MSLAPSNKRAWLSLMHSTAPAKTIDPQLLQSSSLEVDDKTPTERDIGPSGAQHDPPVDVGLGAALDHDLGEALGHDLAGAVDLYYLAHRMLDVQTKIRLLSEAVKQQLTSRINHIWATADARITQLLEAKEFRPFDRSEFTNTSLFEASITPDPDSDVDEADHHIFPTLYKEIREFTGAKTRRFFVIRPLSSRHRRHIHAIAHFVHFGHLSIGWGDSRMILLSRKQDAISTDVKLQYKSARNNFIALQQHPWSIDIQPRVEEDDFPSLIDHGINHWNHSTSVAAGYSSGESSASAGSHFTNASVFSNAPGGRQNKRKRQSAGFHCTHLGCTEKFDRWCDLNHHSRLHLPYDQRPYACEQCNKRFLFPKDLRRHEVTHGTGGSSTSHLTAGMLGMDMDMK